MAVDAGAQSTAATSIAVCGGGTAAKDSTSRAGIADVRSSDEVVSEAGGPNYQLQCSNISEPTISFPPMPQTVIFWPFDRLRAFSGTSGSQ